MIYVIGITQYYLATSYKYKKYTSIVRMVAS